MPKEGYHAVTLPDELVARIDKFFNKKDKNYNSRTEIISHAMELLEYES